MDQKMLDDPDATNTKSIENYFGNLDREIRKAVAQGFGKLMINGENGINGNH